MIKVAAVLSKPESGTACDAGADLLILRRRGPYTPPPARSGIGNDTPLVTSPTCRKSFFDTSIYKMGWVSKPGIGALCLDPAHAFAAEINIAVSGLAIGITNDDYTGILPELSAQRRRPLRPAC